MDLRPNLPRRGIDISPYGVAAARTVSVVSRREDQVAEGAAISLRGVFKRYGEIVAVDGLDLEVPSGVCFGLLGPNGAG